MRGLLGIIENREIWATHTQYLNDTEEYEHACKIAYGHILRLMNEHQHDSAATHVLGEVQNTLVSLVKHMNVCVCCFTQRHDDLSQWRAYGGKSSGFSVGFSGEALRRAVGANGWLVKVEYDNDKQSVLMKELLLNVFDENMQRFNRKNRGQELDDDKRIPVSGHLIRYLNQYAPMLKHGSFKEEDEWRIVTRPQPCPSERFGYREGASMLIPYWKMNLAELPNLGIEEIIIGPTPYRDQSRSSVQGLLTKNGITLQWTTDKELTDVVLRDSAVPYRNW